MNVSAKEKLISKLGQFLMILLQLLIILNISEKLTFQSFCSMKISHKQFYFVSFFVCKIIFPSSYNPDNGEISPCSNPYYFFLHIILFPLYVFLQTANESQRSIFI